MSISSLNSQLARQSVAAEDFWKVHNLTAGFETVLLQGFNEFLISCICALPPLHRPKKKSNCSFRFAFHLTKLISTLSTYTHTNIHSFWYTLPIEWLSFRTWCCSSPTFGPPPKSYTSFKDLLRSHLFLDLIPCQLLMPFGIFFPFCFSLYFCCFWFCSSFFFK